MYKLTGKLQMQNFPFKYSLCFGNQWGRNKKLECTSFICKKKLNECLTWKKNITQKTNKLMTLF